MRRVSTFDLVLLAISVLIALSALVLLVLSDGLGRLAMVLVLLGSTINIGLTAYRVQNRRP